MNRIRKASIISILVVLCWKKATAKSALRGERGSVSFVFGGDVDFSRIIKHNHKEWDCPYNESLKGLKPYFQSADFAMINLETTIKEDNGTKSKPLSAILLSSDESALPALRHVGVDYVSIANNHVHDYREKGINRTIRLLEKHGIQYVGVVYGKDRFARQKPLIVEKNGVKIGILGYCDLTQCGNHWRNFSVGPALINTSNVISEVSSLRKTDGCDIVILFMHWGVEYSNVIHAGVIGIIRELVKGAHIDLIVGGHPHVTQQHWYTNNTLVAQSLGNLLFAPYSLANFNFNENLRNDSTEGMYERLWYKQMLVMKDATMYGKLIKVEFNKYGIIKEKAQYLRTKIFATEKHCLATGKDRNAIWRPICDSKGDDPECTGTPECNYLECDREQTLPLNLPDSPVKDI